ncbi:DUF6789 family protein [Halobacterium yunchengense]|uniref:DUF6789 family protein n=1 Tax=Halobacterium yunchengense TaxID=3108497 RepID=UPI00300A478B
MDPVRRAIAGGVAGTVAMTVVLVIGEVEARFELGVGGAIARYAGLPDQPALGLLVFLVAGMVVFPLVFVAVGGYLARLPGGGDPAIRGMAFSLPLWVLFLAIGSPDLGTAEGALHVAFTLFAHLLYGFTLGAVYHSLADV